MPKATYGVRLKIDGESFFIGRDMNHDQAADLADDIFTALCDVLGTRLSTYAERETTA